ncbi:DUF2794 domain-containing protein [Pelagibacteraceae bacterium]|nr:DUF2794 domain-containing protein [Pelagibacteraceae bacterium]
MVVRYIDTQIQNPQINQNSKSSALTQTFFNKTELNQILSIYGKKVSEGKWKDYAIDHLESSAIFSFFRNTFESASLKIIKHKRISKSKLKYHLVSSSGSDIKRSNELDLIINYLNKANLEIIKK